MLSIAFGDSKLPPQGAKVATSPGQRCSGHLFKNGMSVGRGWQVLNGRFLRRHDVHKIWVEKLIFVTSYAPWHLGKDLTFQCYCLASRGQGHATHPSAVAETS